MHGSWRLACRIVSLIWLAILLGCNMPGETATLPAPQVATPMPKSSVLTQVPPTPNGAAGPPQHRVGVRTIGGVGEFYDRVTGGKFVPPGNNFARLGPQLRDDGSKQIYHSILDPGKYDPADVATQFARMHAEDYNVVRVFVSQNTIGTEADGLSEDYLRNTADFLRIARENDLYVIFTQDWLPGGKCGAVMNEDCCEMFNFNNAQNLPPAAVKAYQLYYTDFINALFRLDAPTDQIFSYELRNEYYFDTDYPPLSLTSGRVTTANGKTYDMSSYADKQRMVEENLPYWIDNIRSTILDLDPPALVSVGFFVPQAPNPARIGDRRLVVSAPAIWSSQADFIDLHAYPGAELNLKEHVENFSASDMQEKPIILGEFGGNSHSYPSPEAAAKALMNWQIESCKYGFDGWLLWTWDLPEQYEFYSALSGNREIDQALAPTNRPDPCQPGESATTETDLGRGRNAKALSSLAGQPPSNAVDGSPATVWNSGAGPTQWIEIDLGKPSAIETIRLTVAQSPAGPSEHQIYVRGPQGELELVHTFTGETDDCAFLEFTPILPLTDVQVIRIVTVKSPSWVARREIEVIGK